ncbi:MAG: aldehyde dehydrogenase [Clostridium sp.]|nr:aldehyde dehydrogenase [Clostridium sp.]
MVYSKIFNNEKEYYLSGETLSVKFRIEKLRLLKKVIKDNEEKLLSALKKDLNKSNFEGYVTEIGILYQEIDYAIKNVKKWAKREKKRTDIVYFPAKSYIYKQPYGVVLIISPFNYPIQLAFSPLIGAISAGNCAIIKPSEYAINSAMVIEEIINSTFDKRYINVIDPLGGKETVSELLSLKFNYIFFTGSVRVGKIVMEAASKNLIPVTLELGGKSPCIVDKDANIKLSAKRIVWGKYLNVGQTCVAPDYVYVHKDVKEKLLKEMVKEIESEYGKDAKKSEDYARIIRKEEVKRLQGYLDEGEIYYGGEVDIEDRYISPTILTNIKENSKILEEEIFGPIFPVYEFEDITKVIEYVNSKERPLALYYFSEDKNKIETVLSSTTSGGVTINDTIIHVSSTHIPFGGVGNSGMGNYHGKASFDTFTHKKSVVKRSTLMEFPFRFPPYKDKLKLIKKLMK